MSLEGTQLGHYKLIRLIGSGGMGEVYLAEDVRIARQVAIKVVKTEPSSYPDEESVKAATRLFQREMRAIVSLHSTHILPMHDFGTETTNNVELTYMVMPYLSEGSLKDWLRKHSTSSPLSPQDIAYIIDQAAYALQDAHDNNIIHQDIKTPNFLIRTRRDIPNRPDVFLADFGIAKFTSATSTASQHVRGTPAYMPPEQWESSPVPASDQYALAIMAYELLTRHLPFQGRMEQVMRQHLMTQPAPPSTHNPQISPALDAVILRALAKKPEERFPSIIDFAHAFQQATAYTDLRATLTLTSQEAASGSNRIMRLPGMRQVTVNVPARTQNGHVIRMEGAGEAYYENGPRGPLVLTVAINDTGQFTGPITTIPNTFNNQQLTRAEQNVTTLSSTMSSGFSTRPPVPLNQPIQETKPPLPAVGPPLRSPQFPTGKKRLTSRTIVLISILLLVVIAGIIGFVTYQIYAQQNGMTITTSVRNANPYPSYLPGKGSLTLYDPLTTPSQWSDYSDTNIGGSCQHREGAFHVTRSQSNSFYYCYSSGSVIPNNFAFEVQMTIINGNCGGITFRGIPSNGQFYVFEVCQGGNYILLKYIDTNTDNASALANGSVSLNQTNTLAVFANGGNIELYVNNSKVNSVNDTSYNSSAIGLFAEDTTVPTDVAYSNARVWALS